MVHQAHFRAMYEPRQGPPRRLGAFAFSVSTTECPAVTQRRPLVRLIWRQWTAPTFPAVMWSLRIGGRPVAWTGQAFGFFGGSLCTSSGHSFSTTSRTSSEMSEIASVSSRNLCSRTKSSHEPFLPTPDAGLRLAGPAHDLVGANTVGAREDDRRPPSVFLRGVTVPGDRFKSAADGPRDRDGNSGAHAPNSHGNRNREIPIRTLCQTKTTRCQSAGWILLIHAGEFVARLAHYMQHLVSDHIRKYAAELCRMAVFGTLNPLTPARLQA